jgi:hypothetical protein
MLEVSGEISSKALSPNLCQEMGFYPLGGLCNQGFFFAVCGSVTGKQVGYRICHPWPPYRMWVQLQETLQG